MAKGIRNYPKNQRKEVIARRVESNTGGLGYLAAVDAQRYVTREELIEKGLIKPLDK
jgi:hypothetical protein